MVPHVEITDAELYKEIREKRISLAGNRNLKIFGKLGCRSGKRMKKENRVFFISEEEALEHGFRPCGHCLKDQYKSWR